jgi:hypothetical protein
VTGFAAILRYIATFWRILAKRFVFLLLLANFWLGAALKNFPPHNQKKTKKNS